MSACADEGRRRERLAGSGNKDPDSVGYVRLDVTFGVRVFLFLGKPVMQKGLLGVNSKTEVFSTLKAARAAGFHDRSPDEYGGEILELKGHTLVRNAERAESRTEWDRRGRRVLAGAVPHCERSASVGGRRVVYEVFRVDQTEAKLPVKPRRKVSPEEKERKRLAAEQRLAARVEKEERERQARAQTKLAAWLAAYPCEEKAIAEAVWILNKAAKYGGDRDYYTLKDKWIRHYAGCAVQRLARVERNYDWWDNSEYKNNLYEVEIECCGTLYLYHTYVELPCYQGEQGKRVWVVSDNWRSRLPSGLEGVDDFRFLADWLREKLSD